MDMDKLVNAITGEVMRRIKEIQDKPNENLQRVLIATSSESRVYKSLENILSSSSYRIDNLENMNEDLDCYENIILCGLNNRELANLALGVQCGQQEQIAINGILKGKKIYLLEEGIEYRKYNSTSNKIFFSMYMEYERKLVSYGITLVRKDNVLEVLSAKDSCNPCQCACSLQLQNEVNNEIDNKSELTSLKEECNIRDFMDKKLVAESDLRKMIRDGITAMNIRKRTVLTPLAKDFIRINKIEVNRIE